MENGSVTRGKTIAPPRAGTRTGRVWEIADEISRRKGSRAERREVVERFESENGNRNTASTQYYEWRRHQEVQPVASVGEPRQEPGDVEAIPLAVAPDGRLLIPARMREAMLLEEDGMITASVVDGVLKIVTPMAAVRRAQKLARQFKKPGENVVDEFLAERRSLWGEE